MRRLLKPELPRPSALLSVRSGVLAATAGAAAASELAGRRHMATLTISVQMPAPTQATNATGGIKATGASGNAIQ